jgi:hypothetical protein
MTGVRALFYYQLSFLRKALWGECELGLLYVTIIVTCILRRFFFQLKKNTQDDECMACMFGKCTWWSINCSHAQSVVTRKGQLKNLPSFI